MTEVMLLQLENRVMFTDKIAGVNYYSGMSRVEAVYQGILQLIKDEGLGEGDKLPSEAHLAERFSISRPVVRQSLTRLQEAGVIQVRWGSGSYVCNTSAWRVNAALNFGPIDSLEGIRHTFEIRMAVESEAAAFAAQRASGADREAIIEAHNRYLDPEARKKEGGEDADMEFHFSIAKASGNPFFTRMMVNVRDPIRFCSRIGRLLAQSNPEERWRRICQEHQEIVEAVLSGDPVNAREVMHRHVTNACARVFQGLTPDNRVASVSAHKELSSLGLGSLR